MSNTWKWIAALEKNSLSQSAVSKPIQARIQQFLQVEEEKKQNENVLSSPDSTDTEKEDAKIFLNGNGIKGDPDELGIDILLDQLDEEIAEKIEKYASKKDQYAANIQRMNDRKQAKRKEGKAGNSQGQTTSVTHPIAVGGNSNTVVTTTTTPPGSGSITVTNIAASANTQQNGSDPNNAPIIDSAVHTPEVVEETVKEDESGSSTGLKILGAIGIACLAIFGLSKLAEKMKD